MIRITIMGSRKVRYQTGCCGSRNQEEVVKGFIPTLYRTFGQDRIRCRYLDVDDTGASKYPDIVEAVRRGDLEIPLAIRDGEVILHGKNTLFELPDYIREALKQEDGQGHPDQTPARRVRSRLRR